MLIRNDTPFAAQGFGDLHHDGFRMAVICVSGSYHIAADGALQLAKSLPPRRRGTSPTSTSSARQSTRSSCAISRYGNTLVSTLRAVYGGSFAAGFSPNAKLSDIIFYMNQY